jgi:hypothetical protein
MMTEARYVVTEVSGRRLPWRVHANTRDPRCSAEGCWTSKQEADKQCASLNAPHVGVTVSVEGIERLGNALFNER